MKTSATATKKTITVQVMKKNASGGLIYKRGGKIVWTKVRVPIIDSVGPWAVTRFYGVWNGVQLRGAYSVTHVPTGAATSVGQLDLRTARRLMKALAAMPDQAYWKRLKNPSRIRKEKAAEGKAVVHSTVAA